MSENSPDKLAVNPIRHLRARSDEVASDMVEVKERLGLLEGDPASVSRRIDRMSGDVERIERRLELTETAAK